MTYNDGTTGRPAVTDSLAFQTSTNTLKSTYFSGAAAATTAYDTANLKNVVLSTSTPGTASSYPTGTVWIQYTN